MSLPASTRARTWHRQYLRISDSAQAESLAAIGTAMAENGKVIVTGCMGAEPEKIAAVHPGVLACQALSNMKACWKRCIALPLPRTILMPI